MIENKLWIIFRLCIAKHTFYIEVICFRCARHLLAFSDEWEDNSCQVSQNLWQLHGQLCFWSKKVTICIFVFLNDRERSDLAYILYIVWSDLILSGLVLVGEQISTTNISFDNNDIPKELDDIITNLPNNQQQYNVYQCIAMMSFDWPLEFGLRKCEVLKFIIAWNISFTFSTFDHSLPMPSLSALRWYDVRHEWILFLMKTTLGQPRQHNKRFEHGFVSSWWPYINREKRKNICLIVCPASSAISISKGWVFSAKRITNQIFEIDDLFIWKMSK